MSADRVLVAGIGNVFIGDDGFGVAVVGEIDTGALPPPVDVVDYGIRGLHLAYDLLDGRHRTLIMVDALAVDGPPGTLAVLDAGEATAPGDVPLDGHGMTPQAVLGLLRGLGGGVDRVFVVGCRPAVLTERMGLSEPVRHAVPEAARLVTELACAEAASAAERRAAHA